MKYFIAPVLLFMLCFSAIAEEGITAKRDEVKGLKDGARAAAGDYLLTVMPVNPVYAGKGVQAMVTVPPLSAGISLLDLPVLVWYHGSTRDENAFRTLAGDMKRRTGSHGYILISIQNWWPLSGDNSGGALDSAAASHAVVSRLMDLGWTDGKRVFVTGFSAGGLTAFATFLRNVPDPYMPPEFRPRFHYRGLGVFKGNFYQDPVLEPPIASSDPEKSSAIREHMKNRLAWLCVGGASDAPRVKVQMPELRNYIRKYLFTDPVYQVYADEGHTMTDRAFGDFWKSLQKSMNH